MRQWQIWWAGKKKSLKKNEIVFLYSEAWRETSYYKNKEKGCGEKPVPRRSFWLINIYCFCDQTESSLWREGSKKRKMCSCRKRIWYELFSWNVMIFVPIQMLNWIYCRDNYVSHLSYLNISKTKMFSHFYFSKKNIS